MKRAPLIDRISSKEAGAASHRQSHGARVDYIGAQQLGLKKPDHGAGDSFLGCTGSYWN